MKRIGPLATKSIVVLLLGILLYKSNDPFLMVRGSDSTSFLLSPDAAIQILCVVGFAAALFVPTGPRIRVGRVILMLAGALIGSHRLVIDNVGNEVRDVYLATTLRALPLDPGHEGGLSIQRTMGGISIEQKGMGKSLWVFSPLVIGLDSAAVAKLSNAEANDESR